MVSSSCLENQAANHINSHWEYHIKPNTIPALNRLHHHQRGVVFIEFVYHVLRSYENNSLVNNQTSRIGQFQNTNKYLRRYEMSMLKSQSQASTVMSSVLPLYGAPRGTSIYNGIVDEIVDRVSNRGNSQEPFGLSVCISAQHTLIHCENLCDRCKRSRELELREMALLARAERELREMALLARAERESEAERMKKMVVPASESAIKNLLKRVRVEEEDQEEGSLRKRRSSSDQRCTVCLDAMGSYATQMPCKHAFHKDCIVGWLRVNHNCPLCRSVVPTDD